MLLINFLKKILYIFICLLFTMLVSCNQYKADFEEYLSYWSTQASIYECIFPPGTPDDAEGYPCLKSDKNTEIILKVRNPKRYKFILPTVAEHRNIITFPANVKGIDGGIPKTDTDYKLEQIDNHKLKLVYTKGFLQNTEWGEFNLNPVIMLYDSSGRKFTDKYSFRVKSNTPPPHIEDIVLAKTKTSPPHYVLCIVFPQNEMLFKIGGKLLHRDIAKIAVTDGSGRIFYPLGINSTKSGFIKPSDKSFISEAEVEKLGKASEPVPSGNWTLFYATGIAVSPDIPKKEFSVHLVDNKGLKSRTFDVNIAAGKANEVQISLVKGKASSDINSETGQDTPIIIIADSTSGSAVLKAASSTHSSVTHCVLTNMSNGSETRKEGSSVQLELKPDGNTPCLYKLETYADGNGLRKSRIRTLYYKVCFISNIISPELPNIADYILDTDTSPQRGALLKLTVKYRNKAVLWDNKRIKKAGIVLYQNGTPTKFAEFVDNTGTRYPQITIPQGMPKGKYEIYLNIQIDGLDISAKKAFTLD